jgi:predicted metal-dependent HD superfamily phosphohydrolase
VTPPRGDLTPDDLAGRWPLPDVELRNRLTTAYGDPRRGYHDLRHLSEVLTRLDELAGAGEPFDELPVRLAAWFHDAVHDAEPGAEERSARLAQRELADRAVEAPVVAEVVRLVRMTEHHRPGLGDANGSALSDADLAILAAPADRYAEYVEDVRREYAAVPDEAFRSGRAAVLRQLSQKPSLFHTAYARQHWELRARENLARELQGL